jgi:16S rRNA (cytosine967-C5)-methyltransferase
MELKKSVTARDVAWQILNTLEIRRAWAEDVLREALRVHPLSAVDARLVRELVFGCVKGRLFLDFVLQSFFPAGRPGRKAMNLLRLGAYQLLLLSKVPPHAAVHATVEVAKSGLDARQAAFINAVLRELGRRGAPPLPAAEPDPTQQLSVLHSFPAWLVKRWVARYGRGPAEELMHAANEAPPLLARVNVLKGTREQALAWLQGKKIEAAAEPGAPQALRLTGAGDPARLPGVAEGWLYFQDPASQLLGYLVDPAPGFVCVDLCAAPGGKATHLAELMHDSGQVWAQDRSADKLKKIGANARRLGLGCVRTGTESPAGLLADRVLVDAPCSGLGTLRRHAEARWRVAEADLPRLGQAQARLLDAGAGQVRPGGHLVYATCTTEPEENEDVARAFGERHPEFSLQPGPGTSGWPLAEFWDADGFFRTLPGHPDMDGMFAARWVKNGG